MKLQFAAPVACVVAGCKGAPVAEVFVAGKRERAGMVRRWGTSQIYACAQHEHDPVVNRWLDYPLWQGLLFAPGSRGAA